MTREAIATCEFCNKDIFEGEKYLPGETYACEACAPTYQDLLDEPEGFVDTETGEQATAEQCQRWYDEYIAAGGSPTDSMAR